MGAKDAATFVRLFMVPGMGHAEAFRSQRLRPGPACRVPTPNHDIEAALERWVEQGAAPEQVVASKVKAGVITSGGGAYAAAMRLSADGPLEGQRQFG